MIDRRQEWLQELEAVSRRAQELAQEVQRLQTRAVFLQGAIAGANETLGVPSWIDGWAAAWAAIAALGEARLTKGPSRAERRAMQVKARKVA